jgi:galactose mutarotase-like enzyme
MFNISLVQKQYETYILSDETTDSVLEVVPKKGGIITRWCVDGKEILYLDKERFTNPELSVRGGVPILFPICGNLPENTYSYDGQDYTLKQHGFARDLEWQIEGQLHPTGDRLQLSLSSNEQTKASYPFDFKIVFTYILTGNSLEIHQSYENLSSTALPFSTGFHPYFVVEDKNQLQFEIPAVEYETKENAEVHPFDGNFDFNQDEIDVAFQKLSGKSTTVIDNSRKISLTLEYDDIFSTLVFWTLKGKDFYCLEPWSASRNALNSGDRLTILQPETNLSTSFKMTVNG